MALRRFKRQRAVQQQRRSVPLIAAAAARRDYAHGSKAGRVSAVTPVTYQHRKGG